MNTSLAQPVLDVEPPPQWDVYTELMAAFSSRVASCIYRICCLNVENKLEATTTSQVPALARQHGQSGSVFWTATGVDVSVQQPWELACAVGSVYGTRSLQPRENQH